MFLISILALYNWALKKSFIIPMAIEIPAFQTANIPYSFSFKTRYSNLFSAFTPEAVDVSRLVKG